MNVKFLFGAAFVALLSSSVAFAASPPFGTGGYPGVTSTTPEKVAPYPRLMSLWKQRYSPDSGCGGVAYLLEEDVLMIEKVSSNCDSSWNLTVENYSMDNYSLLGKVDTFTTIYVRNGAQLSCNGSADISRGCLDNLKEKHKEFLANRVQLPADLISESKS